MNKLLLIAACVAASLLSSCKSDPQSANGPILPLAAGGTSTAHPAVTYEGSVIVKKYDYNTIAVMDSDGANQTNIVTADATEESMRLANWNYSGSSIAYHDFGSAAGGALYPNSIKAVDVSVNAKGVPVGSNVRTIYTLNASDSASISNGLAWCATSSTGKIAFTRQHTGTQAGLVELCTIPQTGGTVTVLASDHIYSGHPNTSFGSPTWSPDDSKIAFFRLDTTGHCTIMILNASKGAALDSIPGLTATVSSLEWSRSGANLLSFRQNANSTSPPYIYYCVPTTGSTPTTNSVTGLYPTWSPNNSSLMYETLTGTDPLMKVTAQTSSTTTLQTGFNDGNGASSLNWKR